MTTMIKATHVRFSDRRMLVDLADGRALSVAFDRYPILRAATVEQRNGWKLEVYGTSLRWEDISIEAILRARDVEIFRAGRSKRRGRRR